MRKLAIFLVVAGLTAFGAGPAGADHVACGDTIAANTVLDKNVGPCAGDGLTITAGVTLDLNHKRIRGTDASGSVGITIDAPGATVLNGSIQKFYAGIYIVPGSDGATIDGVTVKKMTHYGIYVGDWSPPVTSNVSIRNTKIINAYHDGLVVTYGNNFLLENSTIMVVGKGTQGEGESSCGLGNGMFVWNSDGTRILNNKFNEISQSGILSWANSDTIIDGNEVTRTSSRPCTVGFSTDYGAITIQGGSTDTVVRNNVVTDNEVAAIGLWDPSNVTIHDNILARNTSGIFFIAGDNGTTAINDNCIFDSDTGDGLIISDAPTYTVDATYNFWGAVDGPGGDGPLGTTLTGSGELIVQKAIDNVTVVPFLEACHLSEAEE